MKTLRFIVVGVMLACLVPTTRSAVDESEPSYRGTNLTTWLNLLIHAKTEQSFAVSSNAIRQLGTNAVSLLVKVAETNFFPFVQYPSFIPASFLHVQVGGNDESLMVALGARVLGPLAAPIYAQLTNNMTRRDQEPSVIGRRYTVAMITLINSGSMGIWEIMRAIGSTNVSRDLLYAIENMPEHLLPIFVDIHQNGEAKISEASQWLLSRSLASDLDIGHIEELMPLLKVYLQKGDPFLKWQVLAYLGRCTHRMSLAIPVITSQFNDPDETVRIAATNALNYIETTP